MKKTLSLAALFAVPFSLFAETLNWSIGYFEKEGGEPEKYFSATVPGAAQLDTAKAENYPRLDHSDNFKLCRWMEDVFFVYKTSFKRKALKENERLYFVSKGIDYQFDIFFNGRKILSQEGMFTPVNADLTDLQADENELKIVVYPAPKARGRKAEFADEGMYRSQAEKCAKPPVVFGWDWNPRFITCGIWDETYLEIRNAAHIDDAHLSSELNDKLDEAKLSLEVAGKNLAGKKYAWTLSDADGKTVLEKSGKFGGNSISAKNLATLKNPRLWWTHDYGKPHLYKFKLELFDDDGKTIQKISQNIGIRKLKAVLNDGAYHAVSVHTRPSFPMQIVLNGKKIFAKGSNWVNPELAYGTITKERYEELVKFATEANFNIFRCWGGAPVNKESFFDACDKYGVLVWQEFPLACNNYPDDEHYLDVLRREAVSIVKRVRKHPSLAILCGGNELLQSWGKMTDHSHPLRLLNSVCYEYDKKTPFMASSPLTGILHGPYTFYWDKADKTMVTYFQSQKYAAYTEYGVPSISPAETIKAVIPADELWPIKETPSWVAHFGFNAFGKDSWLKLTQIEKFFGSYESLEDLVEKSNFLQSQGYKAIFEEARRQKPYCSMAINWCYNDSWRTVANNSIVAYPNIKKPAFHAIAAACRPVLASARFPKFTWFDGDEFSAELALLNDSYDEIEPMRINAFLKINGKKIPVGQWECPAPKKYENVIGPKLKFKLPKLGCQRFDFILEVENKPQYNSKYSFIVKENCEL